MNIEEAKTLIKKIIESALDTNQVINDNFELIGGDSQLDSMKLVEICLELEDIADDHGFEFDWTSEKAMSAMNSIFKSPNTLTEEFNRQYKLSKIK